MVLNVFFKQWRRILTRPYFLICVFLVPVIALVNSAFIITGETANIVDAFAFSVLNSEALIFLILPSLPFALSYMDEKREHSLHLNYIRCGVAEYVTAKYLAVVSSGFLVVFLGYVLYIIFLQFFIPVGIIKSNGSVGLNVLCDQGRFYEFLFLKIIVFSLSGALFTGITFFFSFSIERQYTVMVLPYICLRLLMFFEGIFKIPYQLSSQLWILDNPFSLTIMGGVVQKGLFVLFILLIIGFFSVWKAERSVLCD